MASIASSACFRTLTRRVPINPSPILRRHYAAELPKSTNPNPARGNAFQPAYIAVAVVFAAVPGYYFLHSDRSAGAGRAAMQEARAKDDHHPSKEYRDPRDSGVKTLEQKKAKEAAEGK